MHTSRTPALCTLAVNTHESKGEVITEDRKNHFMCQFLAPERFKASSNGGRLSSKTFHARFSTLHLVLPVVEGEGWHVAHPLAPPPSRRPTPAPGCRVLRTVRPGQAFLLCHLQGESSQQHVLSCLLGMPSHRQDQPVHANPED